MEPVVEELHALSEELHALTLERRRVRQDVIQPLIEQSGLPLRQTLAAESGDIRLDPQHPELQAQFDAYAQIQARHRRLTTQRSQLLRQLTLREAFEGARVARAQGWGNLAFSFNMECVNRLNHAEHRTADSAHILDAYHEDPDDCFASDAFHEIYSNGQTWHDLEAIERDVTDYIELAHNHVWDPVLAQVRELRAMLAAYNDQRVTATLMSTNRRLGAESRLGRLDPHVLDTILQHSLRRL